MNLLWILTASILGSGIAAIFAGWLKLKRNYYLLIYIPVIVAFFTAFILLNEICITELVQKNWLPGLAGAVVVSALVLNNVFSQPSSPRNNGILLARDVLWPGLTYGLTDALLLSVLPVLAVRLTFTGDFWSGNWYGKVGLGVLALIGSLIVTTAYHIGYTEFRGKKVLWANLGNGLLSLGYIITLNPLAAVLPHMAMHVAAMVHGRETTGQVPPHYTD
jgi:hypothetical protein